MTPVDMVAMPRFGDVQLSPNGQYLSYTVRYTDWAENEFGTTFTLLDLSNDEPVILNLPDAVSEDLDEIVWAPTNDAFLILHEGEEDAFRQAYRYTLEDGRFERLTDHPADVSDVFWPAGAKAFLFTAPQIEPAEERRLREDDWTLRPYDASRLRELWRHDLETGESEPLIADDMSVRRVSVSADGRQITHMRAPEHSADGLHRGDIWTLDLVSGDTVRWTQNDYSESEPQLSPDGSMVSFISTVGPNEDPYFEDKVFLQRSGEDTPIRLQSDLAFEALDHAWSGDGETLYIRANVGLETRLFAYDLDDDALTALTPERVTVQNWVYAPLADTHIARFESAASPGELHILRPDETGFSPVTDLYADWPERYRLPAQEGYTWTGRDGTELEGLLVYPFDYQPGQAYPTVTIIHGGPRSASQFGSWNTSRYLPVLAAEGYLVFLPNHRGGTGYGDAFMRDMFGGYFQNAHWDVLDGVEALIADGLADPDAQIIQGWSAGGHMVNKLITETDRFAAAASGAGASDWLSMHGESDVRHMRSFVFGGMPWDEDAPHDQYAADSPLRDAWRVTTPTLFWSGEDDVRVPPTQSIMMHRAVKAAGAPTLFYQADGEPHNFREPKNQLFKINRELAWYGEHVLGIDVPPALPPEADADVPDPVSPAAP